MNHPKVSESLKINAPASGIWNGIKLEGIKNLF